MRTRSWSPALVVLGLVGCSLLLVGCSDNLANLVSNFYALSCCGVVVVILNIIALVELAGSTKSTSSKLLWALLIIFAPYLGCILYYLFGR